jgi:hypothetical protein
MSSKGVPIQEVSNAVGHKSTLGAAVKAISAS